MYFFHNFVLYIKSKTIKNNSMEDNMENSFSLIATAFGDYRQQLLRYVCYRINNQDDAEDLVQDTFVRLLECGRMLREDTIKSFIFTIAHNLITDYLRRFYKKQDICSYMMESADVMSPSADSNTVVCDLERLEKTKVAMLPLQRKKIYYMNRFMDMSADDISKRLCISKRTVENHLLIGRKEIREYIKQCI